MPDLSLSVQYAVDCPELSRSRIRRWMQRTIDMAVERIHPEDRFTALSATLPAGMDITTYLQVPDGAPKLARMLGARTGNIVKLGSVDITLRDYAPTPGALPVEVMRWLRAVIATPAGIRLVRG